MKQRERTRCEETGSEERAGGPSEARAAMGAPAVAEVFVVISVVAAFGVEVVVVFVVAAAVAVAVAAAVGAVFVERQTHSEFHPSGAVHLA